MSLLDVIVPAVAIGALFLLLSAATVAMVSATPENRGKIRRFALGYLRFYLILLLATVIYYIPSEWTSGLGAWFYNNPSVLMAIVVYVIAGLVLYRLLRRIWVR